MRMKLSWLIDDLKFKKTHIYAIFLSGYIQIWLK